MSLLGKCRLLVVEYFDRLINEIDLSAERSLSEVSGDASETTREINRVRNEFLKEIRSTESKCLHDLERPGFVSQLEHLKEDERLKKRLFTRFCFIIAKNKGWNFHDGLLYVTDRYLSDHQIDLFSLAHYIPNGYDLSKDNDFFQLDYYRCVNTWFLFFYVNYQITCQV
jgi:hypothetical protein